MVRTRKGSEKVVIPSERKSSRNREVVVYQDEDSTDSELSSCYGELLGRQSLLSDYATSPDMNGHQDTCNGKSSKSRRPDNGTPLNDYDDFELVTQPTTKSSNGNHLDNGNDADESVNEEEVVMTGKGKGVEVLKVAGRNGVIISQTNSFERPIGDESSADQLVKKDRVRRSTRQRKVRYETLNASWILDSQHYDLKGYPMLNKPYLRKRTASLTARPSDCDKVGSLGLHLVSTETEDDTTETVENSTTSEETRGKYGRNERFQSPPDSSDTEVGNFAQSNRTRGKYGLRQVVRVAERFQCPVTNRTRRSSGQVGSLSRARGSSRPAKNIGRFRHHRQSHNTRSSSSSSGEEERFEHKKAKSLLRSRNKCLPMNMNAEDINRGVIRERVKIGSSMADIDPMTVDTKVTFDSIGGLGDHVLRLKEMIVLPIVYPEVYKHLNCEPPRGVIFYGPPGTGKTLMARAIANECSQPGRKVAFFMRKGADCLSKWVGESERQLRLLFDQAFAMRPSIIFFDEIDGLAPVRSSKQDQIHASLVSTLLALMDGLDSRGEVIVIGATNRIDAIDPALRRPGRFDREFYFPLPSVESRRNILNIQTLSWTDKPTEQLIKHLAESTVGYCGADLKSLCAEAGLSCLRRHYPQIYKTREKLQLDLTSIKVERTDFLRAMNTIVPSSQRSVDCPGRKLDRNIRPLLQNNLNKIIMKIKSIFPHGFRKNATSSTVGRVHRPRLLLCGSVTSGHTTYLAPAVLHLLENIPTHSLDITTLFGSSANPEEICRMVLQEALKTTPSIIYIPRINRFWNVGSETLRAMILALLNDIDPSLPVFIFVTADLFLGQLHPELQDSFLLRTMDGDEMEKPTEVQRQKFFTPLFLKKTRIPPKSAKVAIPLETLPLAPLPVLRKLNAVELQKVEEEEEWQLRELRLFLREIIGKLARDRRFYMFTRPVNINEVPDYEEIIREPMDLETMMTKIDEHMYACAEEFLSDIDLICANALEYNPNRTPSDKLLRHRAYTLKDAAGALIKEQMESEFEDTCQNIRRSRKERDEEDKKERLEQSGREYAELTRRQQAQAERTEHSDMFRARSPDMLENPRVYPYSQSRVSTAPGMMHMNPDYPTVQIRLPHSRLALPNITSTPLSTDATGRIAAKRRRKSMWSRGQAHRKPPRKRPTELESQKRKLYGEENKENKRSKVEQLDIEQLLARGTPDMLGLPLPKPSRNDTQSNLPLPKVPSKDKSLSKEVHRYSSPSFNSSKSRCNSSIKNRWSSLPRIRTVDNTVGVSEEEDVPDVTANQTEESSSEIETSSPQTVLIDSKRLCELLNKAVKITRRCYIEELQLLHTTLYTTIIEYRQKWDRRSLPHDLQKKLENFEKIYFR